MISTFQSGLSSYRLSQQLSTAHSGREHAPRPCRGKLLTQSIAAEPQPESVKLKPESTAFLSMPWVWPHAQNMLIEESGWLTINGRYGMLGFVGKGFSWGIQIWNRYSDIVWSVWVRVICGLRLERVKAERTASIVCKESVWKESVLENTRSIIYRASVKIVIGLCDSIVFCA